MPPKTLLEALQAGQGMTGIAQTIAAAQPPPAHQTPIKNWNFTIENGQWVQTFFYRMFGWVNKNVEATIVAKVDIVLKKSATPASADQMMAESPDLVNELGQVIYQSFVISPKGCLHEFFKFADQVTWAAIPPETAKEDDASTQL